MKSFMAGNYKQKEIPSQWEKNPDYVQWLFESTQHATKIEPVVALIPDTCSGSRQIPSEKKKNIKGVK